MRKLLPIMLVCFILCSCRATAPSPSTKEDVVINFFFPSPGKHPDMQAVYSEANAILGLPKVRIEFYPIRKYEYFEKLSIYLASKRQIDIAYGNDKNFVSLQQIRENSFTILNPLLEEYGPDIKQSISEDTFKNIKINERIYFIPTLTYCEGYFPFLKIPKELVSYMDTQKLNAIVQSPEAFYQSLFGILTNYLERLSADKLLNNGVDLFSLYETIPLCRYEAIPSTNDLFAYSLQDPNQLVELQNTDGFNKMLEVFELWQEKGYIRKDKMLMHKKKTENNGYILSAFWGGINESGICSITGDEITNNFIYIPLDSYSHTVRLLTDNYIFISKDSTNAAEAMQVINRFYKSDDLYTLLTYGIEGNHFTRSSENTITSDTSKYSMYPNIFPVASEPFSRLKASASLHFSQALPPGSFYKILPYMNNMVLSNYINIASKNNETLTETKIETDTASEIIRAFSKIWD